MTVFEQIAEILDLEYDAFGEPLDDLERLDMISGVINRHRESQDASE